MGSACMLPAEQSCFNISSHTIITVGQFKILPSNAWHEEIRRLALSGYISVSVAVLCAGKSCRENAEIFKLITECASLWVTMHTSQCKPVSPNIGTLASPFHELGFQHFPRIT